MTVNSIMPYGYYYTPQRNVNFTSNPQPNTKSKTGKKALYLGLTALAAVGIYLATRGKAKNSLIMKVDKFTRNDLEKLAQELNIEERFKNGEILKSVFCKINDALAKKYGVSDTARGIFNKYAGGKVKLAKIIDAKEFQGLGESTLVFK